jgi:ribose 5-phosphate isomerase A
MVLGLGTGSTVLYFLEALGADLREGKLEEIRGVATSMDTEERASALGIPLMGLAQAGSLDLAVDGADEVDPALDLIKGLGGALLREKMVVQAARRFVVIVDESKRVDRLGTRAPVPVEVVPFAWEAHMPFFRELGADPVLRLNPDRSPFRTDNGNPVIDLHFEEGVPKPKELDRALRGRAGVVETGLFLGMADRVLLGTASGDLITLDREREKA